MPKVLNKHHGKPPPDAVYVGRPTEWGNPYSHMEGTLAHNKVATREEAVRRFEEDIEIAGPRLRAYIQEKLRGKDLVCWCAPLPCHADVLLRIANEED